MIEKNFNTAGLAWDKMNGLIPVIIQDAQSSAILMLGYMNQEALAQTIETKFVTFFSRSKNRLWIKGETSNNKLKLISITSDCDNDALLILADPAGPTCHTGELSCFKKTNQTDWEFMISLQKIISDRDKLRPENSYTTTLLNSGLSRIAQKVGEEGVEVVLAAIEKNDADFSGEVADLLFHLLVLLKARNLSLSDVIKVLKMRN